VAIYVKKKPSPSQRIRVFLRFQRFLREINVRASPTARHQISTGSGELPLIIHLITPSLEPLLAAMLFSVVMNVFFLHYLNYFSKFAEQ
jgi:hypothetical protein